MELKKVPHTFFISGSNAYQRSKYIELILRRIKLTRQGVVDVVDIVPPIKMEEVSNTIYSPSIFSSTRVFFLRGVDLIKPARDLGILESKFRGSPLPEGHYLVVLESDSKKDPKGSFFDYMRESFEYVVCSDLQESRSEVSKWVALRMGEHGKALSNDIVAALIEIYSGDLETLDAEIEKLLWYPDTVTKEVLAGLVVNSADIPLYYLYEMLSIRNGARSLQRLHEALQASTLRQVINGIVKFLHQILVASAQLKLGASTETIAECLGVGTPTALRVKGAASRHNPLHLVVALNRLSAIDVSVREVGDSLPSLQSLLYFLCERPEKLIVKPGESLQGI